MRRRRWPVAAIAAIRDPGRSSGISHSSTRRRRCEVCGHRYVPIVYGYPAGDMLARAERREGP